MIMIPYTTIRIIFDKRFWYLGLFFNYWSKDVNLGLSRGMVIERYAQCYLSIIPCLPIVFDIKYRTDDVNK